MKITLTKQAINRLKAVINGYKLELSNINNVTVIANNTSNITNIDNQIDIFRINNTIIDNNEVLL